MKKIVKWLLNVLKTIWFMIPKYVLYILTLAFIGAGITKWITHDRYDSQYYTQLVGAIIGFGLLLCVILFVWIRQGYWWITKKGDYASKNKKG